MRIRLRGTADQVAAYAAALHSSFVVVDESDDYRDRPPSLLFRRYLEIELPPADPQQQRIEDVLAEVRAERARQLAKWGVQHRPDGTGADGSEYEARLMRIRCQEAEEAGGAGWRSVLLEEVYEALAEADPVALRAELVQVAAVCTAWVEDIDSRGLSSEGTKEP